MGLPKRPGKANLFAGLLSSDAGLFPKVRTELEKVFGAIDFESDILDFNHTGYYAEEFGGSLKRKFFGFERLSDLGEIYKTKLDTNALEAIFTNNGRRTVNIDPGYVNLAKVVLFSTKDYSHRIHIAEGIFAEVTLFFKDGAFRAWPWTYPDYKTGAYLDIFHAIRNIYKTKAHQTEPVG